MTKKIQIKKPDDFHCHFRQGRVLPPVVRLTAMQFKRATVMPNTVPPILTGEDVLVYFEQIHRSAPYLLPLMTIQINSATTIETVETAKKYGAVAGKIYPQGVTTNSQNGVTNFKALYPVFEKMAEIGMLALFHGEDPWEKALCIDRENLFLPTLHEIATDFPELKIVLEHITTEAAGRMVIMLDNVSATITAHHLVLTLDDVIGGLIQPHNFCKPIAKRPEDRDFLLKMAISGSPKFFFGSDSAPHLRDQKECAGGCAGVFSSPVALPLLAQIFDQQGALDKLEGFTAKFGADFYGLPQSTETIELEEKDRVVPEEYDGIVPFMAGKALRWKVAE